MQIFHFALHQSESRVVKLQFAQYAKIDFSPVKPAWIERQDFSSQSMLIAHWKLTALCQCSWRFNSESSMECTSEALIRGLRVLRDPLYSLITVEMRLTVQAAGFSKKFWSW